MRICLMLEDRGIQTIRTFSDTELNNEMTRSRQIVEKNYEDMMGAGAGLMAVDENILVYSMAL